GGLNVSFTGIYVLDEVSVAGCRSIRSAANHSVLRRPRNSPSKFYAEAVRRCGSLSRNAHGIVASVSTATARTVLGMPTISLTNPAAGGAAARGPMRNVEDTLSQKVARPRAA